MKKAPFILVKSIVINDKPKVKKDSDKIFYKTKKVGKKKVKIPSSSKSIQLKFNSSFTITRKIFENEEQAKKFLNSELKKFKKKKSKSQKFLGSVQIGLGKAKLKKDGFAVDGEISRSGRIKSIFSGTDILTAKNNIIRSFDEAEKSFNEYKIELIRVSVKKPLKNGKMYYWKKLVKGNDNKPKSYKKDFVSQYMKKKGRS